MSSLSEPLLQLIATMSRQEKRYFKLYAAFYTKEQGNNLLRLFEAIERLKPSSAAGLAAAVRSEPYARHLSLLKNQLTEQILDSLLSYGSTKKTSHILQRQIMHADVLSERGLHTQAGKVLARAEKKAVHTEESLLQMEILYRRRALLFKQVTASFEEEIRELYTKGKDILAEISSTGTYREMMDLMQVIATRYSASPTKADKKKMDDIVAVLLENKKEILSFTNALTHHNILGTYSMLVNNTAEALVHYRSIAQLWRRYPDKIEERPGQYLRHLSNYLNCLVTERRPEEFAEITQEIRNRLAVADTDPQIRFNLWNLELLFAMNNGNLDACVYTVAEVEQYLLSHTGSIDPTTYLTLCHTCSIYYFLQGRYARSLEHINLLQAEAGAAIKQDIQSFSRIFSLVAHYELNNHDILDNSIRAAKRYLKKNSEPGALEKAVMSGIRALMTAVDTADRTKAFRSLHYNLLEILHGSTEELLGMTELLFWTQSHLNNCSIRELFVRTMQEVPQSDPRLLFPLPAKT
jgi:hypothetical protein